MRRMALRDFWLRASVLSSTRRHFHSSNAWRSIRYFASVFTAVRCQAGAIHVEPISTRRLARSMFMKRVLPITWPEAALDGGEHDGLATMLLNVRLLDKLNEVFAVLHAIGNPVEDIFEGVVGGVPEQLGVFAANWLQANDSGLPE